MNIPFVSRLAMALLSGALCIGLGPAQAQTAARKAPAPAAAAEKGMLRVACSGEAVGARITINDAPKGTCPFDIALPEGTWTLRSIKPYGDDREQRFVAQVELAAGTAKKVDVEFGEPRLTPEALGRRIGELMAPVRQKYGETMPQCPDCPKPVPLSAPSASLETPNPAEPILQNWLRDAKSQIAAFIAANQTGAVVTPPATAAPFPCRGAENALRSMAGLPSAEDAARMGSAASRVWPVRASCDAKGDIAGPVEFWAFGFSVDDASWGFKITPLLRHYTGSFREGRWVGERRSVWIYGSPRVVHPDPAKREALLANLGRSARLMWSYSDEQPNGYGLTVHLALSESARTQGQSGKELSTTFTRPTAPGRSEEHTYTGTKLVGGQRYKGTDYHGEGFLAMPDGEKMITCYRNGDRVEMDPCKVD